MNGFIVVNYGDGNNGLTQHYYSVSTGTEAAFGDFDKDGHTDVAYTINSFGNLVNRVSIVFGNPNRTETSLRESGVDVGLHQNHIDVADLNQDGNLDIIALNRDSSDISVLLGNGDGTFEAEVRYSTPSGFVLDAQGKTELRCPDVNQDGIPDISITGRAIYTIFGNGDGTFKNSSSKNVGENPVELTKIDINGDGNLDVITVNKNSNDLSVLQGNGDGTFQGAITVTTGVGPVDILTLNLNGDSLDDLAVLLSGEDRVSLLVSNGDGSFTEQGSLSTGGIPSEFNLFDVNGDSFKDLITVNSSTNDASVFLGRSGGIFDNEIRSSKVDNSFAIAGGLDVADINLDSIPDLILSRFITSNGSTGVVFLSGDGVGNFSNSTLIYSGSNLRSTQAIKVTDYGSDGILDVVVVSEGGGVIVLHTLLNDPSGRLFLSDAVFSGGGQGKSLFTDFDGDGNIDVITSSLFTDPDMATQITFGKSDGTFGDVESFYHTRGTASFTFGDFNNDGLLDIISSHGTGLNGSSLEFANKIDILIQQD